MNTRYETDVVAWANEQAALIRAGHFNQLDLVHIAEEIEDVGKSEQRELASRMAVLLAHLLKWQYQPEYPNKKSWGRTIKEQRSQIVDCLDDTPSLRVLIQDDTWSKRVWRDAVLIAVAETGLDAFPSQCPWVMADVLSEGWLPAT